MTPAELAALHGACFTVPRPWSAPEFAEILASKGAFLRALSQGFVLGRVIAGEAELLTICVADDARGGGLGRRLMAAFFEQSQALGAQEAFLEVAQDNAPARALYAATGWQEAGRRRGYYHHPDGRAVDALVLRAGLERTGHFPA